MIKEKYEDGLDHVQVLSYGGGVQSTALLIMSLEGKINGIKPDYIIFSDTGWEPKGVYDWVNKINDYIKKEFKREIIFCNNGSIREDILKASEKKERMASLPYFTKTKREIKKDGIVINEKEERGMVMRQCTNEYKIVPVKNKIKELLGYSKNKRVKEMIHMWKGISTDEIERVKPINDKWITAEHPLVEILNVDRSYCYNYLEKKGLGKPIKSSCIGCPFHDDRTWLDMKKKDPKSFEDACFIDEKIRNMPKLNSECYLHRSCKPLREINFNVDQMDIFDDFINECEGFCGV